MVSADQSDRGLWERDWFKPEKCSSCSFHLGGSYEPRAKSAKRIIPDCVKLFSHGNCAFYSCRTVRSHRCLFVIEGNSAQCLNAKCKLAKAAFNNSHIEGKMFSCEHIVKRKEAIAPMSSHYLSSEFIQQYNCDGATKESLLDIMNSFAMPHLICLTEESFVVYGMPTSSNPVGYCHLSMKGDQLICSSTNCKGYVSATHQEKNKKICMHCHILFCLQSCLTRPPIVTPLTPADAANLLPPSGPQIVTPATPANAANLLPPSQPPIITPPTPTDFANLLPPSGPPIETPSTNVDSANLLPPSGPPIVTPATAADAANLLPPS